MHKSHLETIEKTQDAAREEIREERVAARAESAMSRQHGTEAAKEFSAAIEKNAEAIQSLNNTFIEVQARTQANQQRLIELQIEKMNHDKAHK